MSTFLNASFATYPSSGEEEMPWEMEGFVPRTASGKQKSPNAIRNELQRYIDNSSETQTAIVDRMGVNSNSFRKFMNPKTYKDQWSACQNGTYWAAARLLERVKYEAKLAKATSKKRKTSDSNVAEAIGAKKSKADSKADAEELMYRINQVELDANVPVYDSCPELVKKIKDFLARDGVTKAAFCRALGGINANSLNPFLMGKKQDQCGNITYRRAYVFFEKQRIMEGQPKSNRRLANEAEHPTGFSLEKERAGKYFMFPTSYPHWAF